MKETKILGKTTINFLDDELELIKAEVNTRNSTRTIKYFVKKK